VKSTGIETPGDIGDGSPVEGRMVGERKIQAPRLHPAIERDRKPLLLAVPDLGRDGFLRGRAKRSFGGTGESAGGSVPGNGDEERTVDKRSSHLE
jgi:hypothetical protein